MKSREKSAYDQIILAKELRVEPKPYIYVVSIRQGKFYKANNTYRNEHIHSYSKTSLLQTLHFDNLNYKCDSILHYLVRKFHQLKNY